MDTENIKKELFDFCKNFAIHRVERISKGIKELNDALLSETKSSAGDKHETGRAMTQLEIEKAGTQLADAEKMLKAIKLVNIETHSNTVGSGNLVKTSMANYFVAISAGQFKKDGLEVYCISKETPIGRLLQGKENGSTVSFNGNAIKIEEIL
ncbi:3-oxoacyl-ACP synthase [Cellulophaga sp. HaHaR_3_176]|uniref:3-oxoacyl-ACP synthase n=1 Tax=Cellulophaga sp. HaHaR_3_176 TaxID=1942464 RepID=UPI001C200202|nr:3-oxoacyl-ACP synthase [Cellulophaga sp. HaHaR_3_176]QWX83509.1 3-oxoacyl-ACP synthase [Cellulophaga sp. HaHaR_3_176]